MSSVAVIVVSCICVVLTTMLVHYARLEYRNTRKSFDRMKKLEAALSDPEVVDIVQRMIREPLIEEPTSFLQKRRNKRHILLLIRLRMLVKDEETRQLIYGFIKERVKRHPRSTK